MGTTLNDSVANPYVYAVAVQADGKPVVGGGFNSPSSRLARFNADGTADTDFNSAVGTTLNGFVLSVAVQADGKLVVGGEFTAPSRNLARFNADGSPDAIFNGNVGTTLNDRVSSVAVQADGKLVVGGKFITPFSPSSSLARFNADGTADTAFNSAVGATLNALVNFPLLAKKQPVFGMATEISKNPLSVADSKKWATLESPNGTTISNLTNSPAPTGLPRGVSMPLGQFRFTVTGVGSGATIPLSLYVDSSLGIKGYYKRNRTTNAWTNIATGTTVVGSKTKITFSIQDGGPYDSDGQANGAIVDPGGPTFDLYNPGVPENSTWVGAMADAFDVSPLQGVITYSITGGADQTKFEIDAFSGVLRFLAAPDYEAPTDTGGNNDYDVTITATGATSGRVNENIVVSVLNDEGTDGVILDLAGDQTTFTPGGAAAFVDNDPTLASIAAVFTDPIANGDLLIAPKTGPEDGDFSEEGSYSPPASIVKDGILNGASGQALKYTLTNASLSDIGVLLNNLQYLAPTGGERRFAVALNDGTDHSESVTFTMTGPDTTAPTLSNVSATATGQTTGTLTATADEIAHGYWVLLTGTGAAAPSAAQVKAGQNNTGAAALQNGSGSMSANVAKTFNLTGLTVETGYTVCLIAEDGVPNPSTVTCQDVTTTASPVNGACGVANGLAVSTAPTTTDLCTAGTASSVTGTGPWTCAAPVRQREPRWHDRQLQCPARLHSDTQRRDQRPSDAGPPASGRLQPDHGLHRDRRSRLPDRQCDRL